MMWLPEALKVKARVAVVLLAGGFIVLLLPPGLGADLLGFSAVRDSSYRWAPGLAVLVAVGILVLRAWDRISDAFEHLRTEQSIVSRLRYCSPPELELLKKSQKRGIDIVLAEDSGDLALAMVLEKKGILQEVHKQKSTGLFLIPSDVWEIIQSDPTAMEKTAPRPTFRKTVSSLLWKIVRPQSGISGTQRGSSKGTEQSVPADAASRRG